MRSILVFIIIFQLLIPTSSASDPPPMRVVPIQNICLGNGEIRSGNTLRFSIDSPQPRLSILNSRNTKARLVFLYLGDTAVLRSLNSGELRRQIGLRLNYLNTCNVVNVIWQFGEKSNVVVSKKINEHLSENSQCLDRGYLSIKPDFRRQLRTPEMGSIHSIEFDTQGTRLTVVVDNQVAWIGNVPELDKDNGVIGLRGDNVKFDFDLEFLPVDNKDKVVKNMKLTKENCLPFPSMPAR